MVSLKKRERSTGVAAAGVEKKVLKEFVNGSIRKLCKHASHGVKGA